MYVLAKYRQFLFSKQFKNNTKAHGIVEKWDIEVGNEIMLECMSIMS